jgi:hypothetical protein
MPHVIEIAKSGRASCRGCGSKIEKDSVRFGEEVPNVFAQEAGNTYRYWHLPCAATKLANDLRDTLVGTDIEVPNRAELDAAIAAHVHPDYPYAEAAPNGRAKCRVCQETITKGAFRIVFERVVETSMGLTRGAGYTHARCAMRYPDARDLGVAALSERLTAHSLLDAATLASVTQELTTPE